MSSKKMKHWLDSLEEKTRKNQREEPLNQRHEDDGSSGEEEAVYEEDSRTERVQEELSHKELLLKTEARWADQRIGEILVDLKKLQSDEVEWILGYQRDKGLYFGDAAIQLALLKPEDIFQALARQFGYPYVQSGETYSDGLVTAHDPLGEQAEIFRSIRSQLMMRWLEPGQKSLAIVSPEHGEGRSYIAANLAVVFSQMGRSTLVIDADLRAPKQHIIFDFPCRIGLSTMLTGRINREDLERVANPIPYFRNLSVLAGGAVPPNSVELFSRGTFSLMLEELKKYFDVIIIDTPPAKHHSDLLPIASTAGSALLVVRRHHSMLADTKELESDLRHADVNVVGSVLNEF
jgi:receptor protein-tyrosine kinase